MFAFFQMLGTLGTVGFIILAMGVAWLFTGEEWVLGMLGNASLMISGAFLVGSAKNSNWEKFQLSMPIQRKTLLASQMLPPLLGGVLGLVMTAAFLLIASTFMEIYSWFIFALLHGFNSMLFIVAFTSILGALPFFEDKKTAALTIAFAAGMAMVFGLNWLGAQLELAQNLIVIATTSLAIIACFIAYVVGCKIYRQCDF